jgi:hypothetical protein
MNTHRPSLLDQRVAHAGVLGGVHPDPPAGRPCWGLRGQSAEPLFGVGRAAGLHADCAPGVQAEGRQGSALNMGAIRCFC